MRAKDEDRKDTARTLIELVPTQLCIGLKCPSPNRQIFSLSS
jgi:hypothetical protein